MHSLPVGWASLIHSQSHTPLWIRFQEHSCTATDTSTRLASYRAMIGTSIASVRSLGWKSSRPLRLPAFFAFGVRDFEPFRS